MLEDISRQDCVHAGIGKRETLVQIGFDICVPTRVERARPVNTEDLRHVWPVDLEQRHLATTEVHEPASRMALDCLLIGPRLERHNQSRPRAQLRRHLATV